MVFSGRKVYFKVYTVSCRLSTLVLRGPRVIEAGAYSGVVAKVMTDGSIVEVRDNKLWSSSTADPATHHCRTVCGHNCATPVFKMSKVLLVRGVVMMKNL